jgi:uncharacterized protein YjbI with pentapeptide repeats
MIRSSFLKTTGSLGAALMGVLVSMETVASTYYITNPSFQVASPATESLDDQTVKEFTVKVTKIPGGAKNVEFLCHSYSFTKVLGVKVREPGYHGRSYGGTFTGCPSFVTIDNKSGLVSLAPSEDEGVYSIKFNVTASTGASKRLATSTTILTVNEVTTETGKNCSDGIANGQTVTRTRWATSSVAWDKTCESEVQTGTCNDGVLVFSPNNYTALTCGVNAPRDCQGGVAHGTTSSRPAFSARSVPYGSSCDSVATTQSASCQNGILSSWSPAAYSNCVVEEAPGLACGDLQSGQSKKELFFAASSVDAPAVCEKAVRVTSCSNGVLSVNGPSFDDCVVNGGTQSNIFIDLVNPQGEYSPREIYVNSLTCGNQGELELRLAVLNSPEGLMFLEWGESRSCSSWGERFSYEKWIWSDERVIQGETLIGLIDNNGAVVAEAVVGGTSGPRQETPSELNYKLFMASPLGVYWQESCLRDENGQCDLSGADFSLMDLEGVNLTDVTLRGCNAVGSNFNGLNLSGTDFSNCDLSESGFIQADLTGANLTSVNLTNANLSEANLLGSFLSYSNLKGVIGLGSETLSSSEAGSNIDFSALNLAGLIWDSRYIQGNNFANTNLEGASFKGSYMRGTNFEGANLTDADFSSSYDNDWLWQINFKGADLTRAKFIDSYLLDVTFDEANLTDAVFSGDYYQNVDDVPGSTRHVVVYFRNANMTRVKYLNRQVLYGDFEGANLNCADFTGSTGVPVYGLARCEENSIGGGTDCRMPGTFDTGTKCELADFNFFAILGSTEPTACPAGNITDFMGADGPEDCFCPAGSFDPDGNSCQVSPANTYSPQGASSPTACPVNYASPAGSSSLSDCRNTVATVVQNLTFSSAAVESGQIRFLGVSGSCPQTLEGASFQIAQVVDDSGVVLAYRDAWFGGCDGFFEPRIGDNPGNIYFSFSGDAAALSTIKLRILSGDSLFVMETTPFSIQP